jgi:glycosyltransferase involved in cell wall biosynthesis
MKILFATNHTYLPQRVGGSELSTHHLCKALLKKGVKVSVLSRLSEGDKIWFINRFINRLKNLRHNNFGFPVDNYSGYAVYRGWNPEEGIQRVIDHYQPSVVVVHAGKPINLVEKFLSCGLPTVICFRDVEFSMSSLIFPQHSNLLPIANSNFTASRVDSVFHKTAEAIYPLVASEEYKTIVDRKKAIFVNPIPMKGLNVAAYLAKKRPDVEFEFIESWELTQTQRMIYKKEIEGLKNVAWKLPTLNMRRVYSKAKMVLIPSLWEEGWGRIATEAHINGIPVLATNIGALPESVGTGGLLVHKDASLEEWLSNFSLIWDNKTIYNDLVDASIQYSLRKEIQPEYIVDQLLSALENHIKCCDKQSTGLFDCG